MTDQKSIAFEEYRDQQQKVNIYYKKVAKKTGNTYKALGWASEESQIKRFKRLISARKNWKNQSILDVGCGFGDFYDFLQQYISSKDFDYLGIDCQSSFVEEAQQRYPGINVLNMDFLNYEKKHDIVISNGTFNFLFPKHLSYFKLIIKKLTMLTKKQCIVSCLSDLSEVKIEKLFYYFSKDELNNICHSLNINAQIQDYKINDQTVDYIIDISC